MSDFSFSFDSLNEVDACRPPLKAISYNCLKMFDTGISALAKENSLPARKSRRSTRGSGEPYFDLEVYQAFMAGYVKRINDATLRVPIGGVRIGSAKYSRLAQINLHSHIITFSRFAIENVPERGRRYLVIHELAHVKEASHNKRFWQLVAAHEPRYKEIGRELDQAFKKNVRLDKRLYRSAEPIYQTRLFPVSSSYDFNEYSNSLTAGPPGLNEHETVWSDESERSSFAVSQPSDPGLLYPLDSGVVSLAADVYDSSDDDLNSWEILEGGIVHGGSDGFELMDEEYQDQI
jgi:hypothetical protein